MANTERQPPISVEFGLGSLLAIILAAADMSWWVRSLLVLVGLALAAHLSWRAKRGLPTRIAFGAVGAIFLLSVTWQPIWRDFHEKHPDAAPIVADGLNRASEIFAGVQTLLPLSLALAGLLIIGWGWHPIWTLRRNTISAWRHVLNQKSWISQEDALRLTLGSRWARARAQQNEPARSGGYTLAATLSAFYPQIDPAKAARNSMFYRWCEIALRKFSQDQSAVRKIENSTELEYDEDALKGWLEAKYESDVMDAFGPI